MALDFPKQHSASYRDPSGFVFTYMGEVYRQVNQVYKKNFERFIDSGLYEELIQDGILIPHEQLNENLTGSEKWYTTLKPQQLDFISFPYEWCFDQLKDAALLTLILAQRGLEHNMILKDATPFNIQLHRGRLMFIDSLSFEEYDETKPWVAYRQFCETFLAPLTLMYYHQEPLQPLLLSYPDGVPLYITSSLLPWRSRLNLHVYLHIHLQNKVAQRKYSKTDITAQFSRQKLLNILKSLQTLIESFSFRRKGIWSDYYEEAEQRSSYLQEKKNIISEWAAKLTNVSTALDLGANDGTFSEILYGNNIRTISVDGDHFSISKLYNSVKHSSKDIYPILQDLSTPTPSIGFNNEERLSFLSRSKADLVLALAFIHHLAVGKNIPFDRIASMFKELGRRLVIEFVPITDEKVQLMLVRKEDIFEWYTETGFTNAFSEHFNIQEIKEIASSDRRLYLMEAK